MILVFGANGQVGRALAQQLAPGQGQCLDRQAADFTCPGAVTAAIDQLCPKFVINAAAYTDVDQAETEADLAQVVNATAVAEMAKTCAQRNIPLVHISTDYVFSGQGDQPWQPNDKTAPLNRYGHSKLDGEKAVRAANGIYVILRTSWVFSQTGRNFVTTMCQLAQTRRQVAVVADQWGGPTPAKAIAEACLILGDQLTQDHKKSGTYHFAGAPDVNWAGFARVIFEKENCNVQVTDMTADQYPTLAHRPQNSRLDCHSLTQVFGIPRPDWQKNW